MVVSASLTYIRGISERLWSQYDCSLKRKPLLTKSVTSLVGSAVGDAIAQAIEPGRRRYDVVRTARLAAIGGAVTGPMAHGWFEVLDKSILPNNSKHPVAVISKTILDQVVMAPLGTVVFYIALEAIKGSPQTGLSETRKKLPLTLSSSYKIWPAAHLVNFAFVAPDMRVLYTNIISVAWAVILSTIASCPSTGKGI